MLRVMLAGHPRLFAPPELELLSFNTLAERRDAFSGRDSFWLEGLLRAVMELKRCGAEEARGLVGAWERDGWTSRRCFAELQGWLAQHQIEVRLNTGVRRLVFSDLQVCGVELRSGEMIQADTVIAAVPWREPPYMVIDDAHMFESIPASSAMISIRSRNRATSPSRPTRQPTSTAPSVA